MKILKEYVKQVMLLEKIRSHTFNFSHLKSLTDLFDIEQYVEDKLKFLGSGSSRRVYVLSSKSVLKIARHDEYHVGIAQNEAELDVYTNSNTKPIVAKILNYHPKFFWIVSELVKPVTADEFEKIHGRRFETFLNNVQHIIDLGDPGDTSKSGMFELFVAETIINNDLMMGDIEKQEHWGKTSEGRLVLLDYGFTDSVAIRHYSRSSYSS